MYVKNNRKIILNINIKDNNNSMIDYIMYFYQFINYFKYFID